MPSTPLVLVADRLLTLDANNTVYAPGAVAIVDGRIAQVGSVESMPAGEIEHLADHVLLPGLVNTHTHTPMWLFRGLTEDVPRGQWLADRMRPLEERVTPEDLSASALAGCLELLLNGVTTIADRYGEMDAVAPVVEASGLRAIVAYSLYDRTIATGLVHTEGLIERYGTDPRRSRVTVAIGPHATDSCGPDLLRQVRRLADRSGARIVIHLAQSESEVASVGQREGVDCATYLERLGLLGPDVVVAHATYLSPSEAELVGFKQTAVAHCPSSNAKLEARVAPIARLREAGATIGLGTDAACCNNRMDLFEEMKLAGLLNKVALNDPSRFTALELLRMATIDAARALGLDDLVGSIEVGKRADLIGVRMSGAHLQPWHDDAANLVYSARGSDVASVWIDGERLVQDGRPTRLDASVVLRAAGAILAGTT
jgi:5-methylthioadenosine/S-adenosylhomocysteine deaminase